MPTMFIAVAKGIAFAFPDVCNTPGPAGPIPVPYPNIAMLDQADPVSETLTVGSDPVLLEDSEVASSVGNEAGSQGGVKSGKTKGKCVITKASKSVTYGGKGLVRFLDPTEQNDGNANGFILSAVPTVLVGD